MRLPLILVLSASACGGSERRSEPEESVARTSGTHDAERNGGATGRAIEVDLVTDEKGSYFRPADITASEGDVIRFKLKSGVHNVHFLPDSNPRREHLPAAGEMLQLPDQVYELKVALEEGRYYFQCDPHAALGMVGHLRVVERGSD